MRPQRCVSNGTGIRRTRNASQSVTTRRGNARCDVMTRMLYWLSSLASYSIAPIRPRLQYSIVLFYTKPCLPSSLEGDIKIIPPSGKKRPIIHEDPGPQFRQLGIRSLSVPTFMV